MALLSWLIKTTTKYAYYTYDCDDEISWQYQKKTWNIDKEEVPTNETIANINSISIV